MQEKGIYFIFIFIFFIININYGFARPEASMHQQQQQQQEIPNSEALSEQFYDEVRQLLNTKLMESNGLNEQMNNDVSSGNGGNVDTSHLDSPPKPKEVKNWPKVDINAGQITAVAINPDGNPVIFHRADRIWTEESFNESDYYQFSHEGPIKDNTVLTLDTKTGEIIDERGDNLFYMPHGMTIDRHGNTWVTDVALHQVFKFRPNFERPMITIGRRFQPGVTQNHLCKPTAVAIATTGEIFIADGYCNNRILKFNAAARLLRVIPQPPEFLSLQIPHALTLLEHLDLICIADRENMRVVCPKAGLKSSHGEGSPAATIQEPDLGRVYAVAAYGDLVYAVNGPTSPMLPIRGFTIDPRSETIIDHWGNFENPHSIAFCPNGSAMYVTEIGPNKLWKFELQ